MKIGYYDLGVENYDIKDIDGGRTVNIIGIVFVLFREVRGFFGGKGI